MQPKDIIRYGEYTVYFYDGNGNITGQTVNGGPIETRDYLTAGPTVQGNFVLPNTFGYTSDVKRNSRGYRTYLWAGRMYHHVDGIYHDLAPLININSGLTPYEVLYNRALERLNEATRGGLDLAIDLAQAGQTKDMFGKNFGKSFSGLANFASNVPLVKRAGNALLEFQYGWRPLMGSLFGALDESVRYVLNKIKKYRGRAKAPISPTSYTEMDQYEPYGKYIYTRKGYSMVEISVSMDVPDFDIFRWTSFSPMGLAWELIPYSFVVDWVYDIGSMLRGLETGLLYNQRFRSGYVTHTTGGDGSVLYTSDYTNAWNDRYIAGGSASRRIRTLSRNVLVNYPLPYRPSLNLHLGSEQMMNLGGLMSQGLGRGR